MVDGLVVGPHRWRMVGYERHDERGPALFAALFRLLHRDTRYAAIDEVDIERGRQVHLRRPWRELPRLLDLPSPGLIRPRDVQPGRCRVRLPAWCGPSSCSH